MLQLLTYLLYISWSTLISMPKLCGSLGKAKHWKKNLKFFFSINFSQIFRICPKMLQLLTYKKVLLIMQFFVYHFVAHDCCVTQRHIRHCAAAIYSPFFSQSWSIIFETAKSLLLLNAHYNEEKKTRKFDEKKIADSKMHIRIRWAAKC